MMCDFSMPDWGRFFEITGEDQRLLARTGLCNGKLVFSMFKRGKPFCSLADIYLVTIELPNRIERSRKNIDMHCLKYFIKVIPNC